MTDVSTIRGAIKPKSPWFGGACIAYGGPGRTRVIGTIRGERVGGAIESDDYSEPLGAMRGSLSGEIILDHLGRTAAERADARARARAATVDAVLAYAGVRPRCASARNR